MAIKSGVLQDQDIIEGEVFNAIGNQFLVDTNDTRHPHIDLAVNFLTLENNPLLAELALFDKLKLERITNPETFATIFKIVELTHASALEVFTKTFAAQIERGLAIPNNLSSEQPGSITIADYLESKKPVHPPVNAIDNSSHPHNSNGVNGSTQYYVAQHNQLS